MKPTLLLKLLKICRAAMTAWLVLVFAAPTTVEAAAGDDVVMVRIKIATGGQWGIITTDKGDLYSPNPFDRIEMEHNDVVKLSDAIASFVGKDVLLYRDGYVVVGISAPDGSNKTAPPFTVRLRQKYKGTPLKVGVTIKYWQGTGFALAVVTDRGAYCIESVYENRDYEDRVMNILKKLGAENERLNIPATLTVHSLRYADETEDGLVEYDCSGDLADIVVER